MQSHDAQYHRLMLEVKLALDSGRYSKAVILAAESFPHIDRMLRYQSQSESRKLDAVPAIEAVLFYAPLVFDYRSINALGDLLRSFKRVDNYFDRTLGERLETARKRMWENHRLWSQLDSAGHLSESDVRPQGRAPWASLNEWEKMGVVVSTSLGVSGCFQLTTRMGEMVFAKCSSCGRTSEGPKAAFLEPTRCDACRSTSSFVIHGGDRS
jgi:hypothetical protein